MTTSRRAVVGDTACPPALREDDDLVAGARAGDREAFAALVTRYQPRAIRLARRLSGNSADADEIVQDAFLQVLRRVSGFRRDATFSTWLFRIVTNAALMHRRARRRRPAESLDAFLPAFTREGRHRRIDLDHGAAARIEDAVHGQQLRRLLFDALARLPPRYRAAVVLRDLEELPGWKAAEILRIDDATLRQRVHRARLMLRGLLDATMNGGRTR